jgi:hypothetical protein
MIDQSEYSERSSKWTIWKLYTGHSESTLNSMSKESLLPKQHLSTTFWICSTCQNINWLQLPMTQTIGWLRLLNKLTINVSLHINRSLEHPYTLLLEQDLTMHTLLPTSYSSLIIPPIYVGLPQNRYHNISIEQRKKSSFIPAILHSNSWHVPMNQMEMWSNFEEVFYNPFFNSGTQFSPGAVSSKRLLLLQHVKQSTWPWQQKLNTIYWIKLDRRSY